MFLQALELTTALRPELLPDETLLFVQDSVGLYEGYAHLHSISNVTYTAVESSRSLATKMDMPTLRLIVFATWTTPSPGRILPPSS